MDFRYKELAVSLQPETSVRTEHLAPFTSEVRMSGCGPTNCGNTGQCGPTNCGNTGQCGPTNCGATGGDGGGDGGDGGGDGGDGGGGD